MITLLMYTIISYILSFPLYFGVSLDSELRFVHSWKKKKPLRKTELFLVHMNLDKQLVMSVILTDTK